MPITNAIARAHVEAFNQQGTVASMIRKAVENKQWDQVGEAYGQLLETYGKRSRIKGTKDFSASTPADTLNAQIQAVTKDMDCGKLRPVLIELEDGSEKWGLETVQSKRTTSQRAKKLEDIRKNHVDIMEGRTMDEKAAEVMAFAEALGVHLPKAEVSELPKAGKSKGRKAA